MLSNLINNLLGIQGNLGVLYFLPYALIAFIASLLLTPWVIKLAFKLKVVQYPPKELLEKMDLDIEDPNLRYKLVAAKRRLAKPPTPLWGGLAYVSVFLIVSIIVLWISKTININSQDIYSYLFWFLGLIILFVLGILDDKYELHGKRQFVIHLIAAFIFALSPFDLKILRIPFLGVLHLDAFTLQASIWHIPISFIFPGDIIVIAWIIAMLLSLKMQAGTDALMEGNTVIAAIIIFIVSLRFHQYASGLFAIIFAGALLGFTIYNFFPAYIFSGSSGKSVVGYLIATLSLISGAKMAVAFIVFSIPLIDMVYVVIKRIFHYKLYRSPRKLMDLFSISDRFHLHYRLMRLGWSEVQIALFEYSITLFIGLVSVILVGTMKILFLLAVWSFILIFIIFINRKVDLKHKEEILHKSK